MANQKFCTFYESKVGKILLTSNGIELTGLQFSQDVCNDSSNLDNNSCELFQIVISQLKEYFSGNRIDFSIPLAPQGTNFQHEVWAKLLKIPFGTVWSYSQLAQEINKPKSYRAVGNASGKNPIAILIPCHRIVSNNGKIGGYNGGIDIKQKLLNIENAFRILK